MGPKNTKGKDLHTSNSFQCLPGGSSTCRLTCSFPAGKLCSAASQPRLPGPWALRRPRELGSIFPWGLAQIRQAPSTTRYNISAPSFPTWLLSLPHPLPPPTHPPGVLGRPLPQTKLSSSTDLPCSSPCWC